MACDVDELLAGKEAPHHDEEDMFPEVGFEEFNDRASLWARDLAPDGKTHLWYPGADRSIPMAVKGTYDQNYPVGAVIHATVGRTKKGDIDAENTIKGGSARHLYFCISSTGKVYQPAPLNKWGVHAGRSHASDLGANLDNKLVGIELCCAGMVVTSGNGFKPPGWNETFTAEEVRYSEKMSNVTKAGHYHKYNSAQEVVLVDLLMWLKRNNPEVFQLEYVFGHDEIAVNKKGELGRKKDPGASLSMYMPDFRSYLLKRAAGS